MLRIVDMATAGVYVVMREGRMVELGGRSHWYDIEDVRRVLKGAGHVVRDEVLTTRVSVGPFGPH